ncbi:hypothetical protein M405DRAFT_848339, partial [Rhizopogon salebrosus TDB-379]
MWCDPNAKNPYIAITAHWIVLDDGTAMLVLKAGLIAFHCIPGSHTGEMGHFTLDNAGNNQTALNEVSSQLIDRGIDFDPINHRIPCFPHIINLCAQRIINMFSSADFSNVADSWVDGTTIIDKEDYIAA